MARILPPKAKLPQQRRTCERALLSTVGQTPAHPAWVAADDLGHYPGALVRRDMPHAERAMNRKKLASGRLRAAAARVAVGVAVGLLTMTGSVLARPLARAAAAGSKWTVYHANRSGSGVYRGSISLSHVHQVWQSPALTGQLYGEPLVKGKYVYVATTADVVYALNAADGSVAWSTTVGTPVSASSLPCGNITPTVGIVGTPVIDPARHEIFAVADELVNGSPSHHLVGLDTTTGELLLDQVVDPPGRHPLHSYNGRA